VTSALPAAPELALFMLAALVLNATPGVDLLLTVARTAAGGMRAGLAAAVGISTGCVLHALAAAFGLAALLAVSGTAFGFIKWAGAAYLLWLGVGLLRSAWRDSTAALPAAPQGRVVALGAEFRRGLLTNVLNPKIAIFFLAFLPQFIPAQAAHKTAAFLLLGALFVLQGTLFLFAVVALTARLARSPRLAQRARALRVVGGLMFVGLALRLAGSRAD
jgi:threonine/homoserine/homoserine lactone efflux protein